MKIVVTVLLLAAVLGGIGCTPRPRPSPVATIAGSAEPGAASLPVWRFRVVRLLPHDREAFTQGFASANGVFYEGTGLHGKSSIRQVDVETGAILRSRALPPECFGEGIAVMGARLVQLTYTSRRGFVYRADTFDSLGTFSYDTEGWGLTYDGHRFIMSDGTATLRMLDPESFQVVDSLLVTIEGAPLPGLNELEYVRGEIFANVWPTFFIARIDPRTGRVLGIVDLRGILPASELPRVDVLNGIAYDALEDRLYVTGKLWPFVAEIELVPP